MIDVLYDIAPAVHQGAGLARYAERLASHLLEGQAEQVNLRFFYNRHSGHLPPAGLRTVPAVTVPLGQLAWRLSVLASQAGAADIPADPAGSWGRGGGRSRRSTMRRSTCCRGSPRRRC